MKRTPQGLTFVFIHVDDGIIASTDHNEVIRLKNDLYIAFKMKYIGSPNVFLALEIIRNREKREIYLSQKGYLQRVLIKFKMENSASVTCPMLQSICLRKLEEGENQTDAPYQQVLGSLMYAMVATRPDLSFVIQDLSRFMSYPGNEHWKALKTVLRYIRGSVNLVLKLGGRNTTSKQIFRIEGFADADFARDLDTRKSVTGYAFFFNNSLISWASRKQSIVALHTAEAEYIATSAAGNEAIWLQWLLTDMDLPIENEAIRIWSDNKAGIAIANDCIVNHKTKHIDIRIHNIWDRIEKKQISLQYIPTKENIADLFTKPICGEQFRYLRNKLNLLCM